MTHIYLNGVELSSELYSAQVNNELELLDQSTFGNATKVLLAGLGGVSITLEGYFDSDIFFNLVGVLDQLLTISLGGDSCVNITGVIESYEIIGVHGEMIKIQVEFKGEEVNKGAILLNGEYTESGQGGGVYIGETTADESVSVSLDVTAIAANGEEPPDTEWTQVAGRYGSESYILSLASLNDEIYGGTSNGGLLLKWNGVDAWVQVAGRYGSETGIFALTVLSGEIYGASYPLGLLLKWNGVDAWVQVAGRYGSEQGVLALAILSGEIYGASYPLGLLLKWNGVDAWVQVAGSFASSMYVDALVVLNDEIYGGTCGDTNGGKLLKLSGAGSTWDQRGSILTAGDAGTGDNFGFSAALSADGSVLIVGAPYWDGTGTNQGGVYTYDRSGDTWVQRGSILVASDAISGDVFGSSVALSADGSVLVVGATYWEGSFTDQGGVYTYDRSGDTWVQRGSVLAGDNSYQSYFGSSVALSADGSILVVGAINWGPGETNQGGVYTYDRSGDTWIQRGSVLVASDAEQGDKFGSSVALSSDGTVLTVGAASWHPSGITQGAVYTYDLSGGVWIQRGSVLLAGDATGNDAFGASVAISADGLILVVGAQYWENATLNQGGVYIYDFSGGAWVQRGSVLVASDAYYHDYFGASVALAADGSALAAGARQWEGSFGDQGAVYTYDRSGGWEEVAPRYNAEASVYSLAILNDEIYGGTGDNGLLLKWNGVDAWTQVAGRYGSETGIFALAILNDEIYGGTEGHGLLLKWNGVDAWTQVAGQYGSESEILALLVSGDLIYAGSAVLAKLLKWSSGGVISASFLAEVQSSTDVSFTLPVSRAVFTEVTTPSSETITGIDGPILDTYWRAIYTIAGSEPAITALCVMEIGNV